MAELLGGDAGGGGWFSTLAKWRWRRRSRGAWYLDWLVCCICGGILGNCLRSVSFLDARLTQCFIFFTRDTGK